MGKVVEITFSPHEAKSILLGKQTAFACARMYEAFSRFIVRHEDLPSGRFEIEKSLPKNLGFIAKFLFDDLGYDSPEAFKMNWKKENGEWDPDKRVFVHLIWRVT